MGCLDVYLFSHLLNLRRFALVAACNCCGTEQTLAQAPPTVRIVHSGHACNIEEERYTERVYTIREGETLELTCLVTGHPRPQIILDDGFLKSHRQGGAPEPDVRYNGKLAHVELLRLLTGSNWSRLISSVLGSFCRGTDSQLLAMLHLSW
ncbi:hypothetical protein GJAV_G00013870 [Gymnothorax javanicus]|nr:hypothetical protein GJAV_G00013870 [Gymnothorax javanicus]